MTIAGDEMSFWERVSIAVASGIAASGKQPNLQAVASEAAEVADHLTVLRQQREPEREHASTMFPDVRIELHNRFRPRERKPYDWEKGRR